MGLKGRGVLLLVLSLLAACSGEGEQISSYLQAAGFSGVALVVHEDDELLREGFGYADRELRAPNEPDHIFRIGSLTKPLTATAVLVAEQQHLLDRQDPLCDYLRVCPASWWEVRIEHLLEHTSGIPDLFGRLERAPLLETRQEIDRVLRGLDSIPLTDLPGATYRYSNFNYMLLGYILAIATGSDWETFLLENVARPAGLEDTRYDDVWEIVERRVQGYELRDGEPRNVRYDDHSAYAAGGLHSTVEDLRRWHRALRTGEIVDSAQLDRMFRPNEGGYGLGWQVVRALGREMRNHTGGVSGFSSHLTWYPEEELLIILLWNLEDQPLKALACDIARMALGTAVQPAADPDWLSKTTDERCAQQLLD